MRKTFTPAQKVAVILDCLKGQKTINEIASEYGVHPTQIHEWKTQVLEAMPSLFADKRTKDSKTKERLIDELYQIIGRRETELAWLKKKLHLDP
jgi:transposase-like protein